MRRDDLERMYYATDKAREAAQIARSQIALQGRVSRSAYPVQQLQSRSIPATRAPVVVKNQSIVPVQKKHQTIQIDARVKTYPPGEEILGYLFDMIIDPLDQICKGMMQLFARNDFELIVYTRDDNVYPLVIRTQIMPVQSIWHKCGIGSLMGIGQYDEKGPLNKVLMTSDGRVIEFQVGDEIYPLMEPRRGRFIFSSPWVQNHGKNVPFYYAFARAWYSDLIACNYHGHINRHEYLDGASIEEWFEIYG